MARATYHDVEAAFTAAGDAWSVSPWKVPDLSKLKTAAAVMVRPIGVNTDPRRPRPILEVVVVFSVASRDKSFVYNEGEDNERTLNDVAEAALDILRNQVEPKVLPLKSSIPFDYEWKVSKASKQAFVVAQFTCEVP